jgi:hypothetical protein
MLKAGKAPHKVFRVSVGEPWKLFEPRFHNRFDIDVEDEPTATIYTGESAEAAIAEVLAPLRPDLETIAKVNSLPGDDLKPSAGVLSNRWLNKRNLGQAIVRSDVSIVDLSSVETINALRAIPEIAKKATECGFSDVDEASLKASGPKGRKFTQTVAAYVYNQYFSGVRYGSRLGSEYFCVAAFVQLNLKDIGDSEFIEETEKSVVLNKSHESVQRVANIFGLQLVK